MTKVYVKNKKMITYLPFDKVFQYYKTLKSNFSDLEERKGIADLFDEKEHLQVKLCEVAKAMTLTFFTIEEINPLVKSRIEDILYLGCELRNIEHKIERKMSDYVLKIEKRGEKKE